MLLNQTVRASCSNVEQENLRAIKWGIRCNSGGEGITNGRTMQHYNLIANFSKSFIFTFVAIVFLSFIEFSDAQGLNDPITQYIEGRLGNRRIYWCPSGYGYLAYCPQPTDWDNYTWCCTWPYMGSWKPSCCPFALPTGAVVAIIIASIILVSVLVGLSCWCCFCCPLYKKLYEYEDDDDFEPLPPSQQARPFSYGQQ